MTNKHQTTEFNGIKLKRQSRTDGEQPERTLRDLMLEMDNTGNRPTRNLGQKPSFFTWQRDHAVADLAIYVMLIITFFTLTAMAYVLI